MILCERGMAVSSIERVQQETRSVEIRRNAVFYDFEHLELEIRVEVNQNMLSNIMFFVIRFFLVHLQV